MLHSEFLEAVSSNSPEYSVISPTFLRLTSHHITQLCNAFTGNTVVTALYLDGNHLEANDLCHLTPFLSKPQVEVLSLCECDLTDESLQYVKQIIRKNTSLQELSLNNNQFSDKGVQGLAAVLEERSHPLTSISLEGNEDVTPSTHALLQKSVAEVGADSKGAIARLQNKLLNLTLQLKAEQMMRRTETAPPTYRIIHPGEISILEKIGTGASAKVYRGIWLGKEVAIKKLKDNLRASAVEALKREISLMSQLRHPNIVMLMGVYQDPEKPQRLAIVSEFMHHGCLFDLLEQCRENGSMVDPDQMVAISRDIALGVLYLHSLNPPIIHRDLKSLNILLDENAIAKVCDFGLSRQQAADNNTMTRGVGTPHWVAPEILRSGKYSEKVDVYSYGVLLWELYTCKIPYEGVDTGTLVTKLCEDPTFRLPIPDDADPRWAKLMNMCFEHDPSKRPSMSEVVEFLDTNFAPQE
eukprot:TRINITY_DN560_c0_g1_i1.p1 TRINITY_DN560_c0_g1~~TRINITY_DN560_c0_g1_i1.p1  ORF type:complete len:468 (+),score=123.97 TRINITY_DN560_c0_g1_i1:258-1661(+)